MIPRVDDRGRQSFGYLSRHLGSPLRGPLSRAVLVTTSDLSETSHRDEPRDQFGPMGGLDPLNRYRVNFVDELFLGTDLKMMRTDRMCVNLKKSYLPIEIGWSVEVLWASGAKGGAAENDASKE